ncbi:MAG: type IV secretion system DNA-binding domain-containing protein [Candidatus Scalindua sp.]|jgi:hypothetical protein|nr:type IV secretion system DNA-binding domain-containing protein [Candidatus Scalindua sp.]MBT7592113.1 type IV secretion system DNA-binding domain-containing protein [Candidatus Scalindua sp.]
MGKPSKKSILLGTDAMTGEEIYTTPKERGAHTHVMGSTDEGKSFGLENMIRQDIRLGNGVCLIDPHGTLYDKIVRWCVTYNFFDHRKIVLLNPSDKQWAFGFNPFNMHGSEQDITARVDSIAEAIATVSGENIDTMPQLRQSIKLVIHTLMEKNLTLHEAKYLMNPIKPKERKYLTKDIQNAVVFEQWEHMNTLRDTEFDVKFGASTRRIIELITSPALRNIFGQTEKTLNTRAIMDEGGILLVNLNPKGISLSESRLLGKLLVNDFTLATRQRDEGDRRFYLYIDECGRYVSSDTAVILDELRKRGLSMTLCHHFFEQIRNEAGEVVCESIIQNTKSKMLFGGISMKNLAEIIPDVFAGHINWEEPIESLIKPTVVGQEKVILQSHTTGRSSTQGGSSGSSSGNSSSNSNSGSDTTLTDEDGNVVTGSGSGSGSTQSSNYGTNESESWSDTESEQDSQAETFKNIYKMLATQIWSKDAQIHKVCEQVRMQLQQHAVIQIRKKKPVFVKIPTIKPGHASKERVKEKVEENYKLQEITKPTEEIEQIINKRSLEIEHHATGKYIPTGESEEEFTTYRRKRKKTTS